MKKYLLLIPVLFFLSCGPGEENLNPSTSEGDTLTDSNKDTARFKSTRAFFYSLPSPLSMAAIYSNIGLRYNESLPHDPLKADSYSTLLSRSVNLGIYSSDLAYSIVNNNTQSSLKYLEAIRKLAMNLNMGNIFNWEDYFSRFKNNLNKKDTLAFIMSELKQEMDCFMYDNEKENMSLFIFSGAWIESLYLSSQSIKDKPNRSVSVLIAEQKYLIDNLLNIMNDYQNEPGFEDLFQGLTDLKKSFDKMTTMVGDEVSVTNVNEHSIKELTLKVASLRNKFISRS